MGLVTGCQQQDGEEEIEKSKTKKASKVAPTECVPFISSLALFLIRSSTPLALKWLPFSLEFQISTLIVSLRTAGSVQSPKKRHKTTFEVRSLWCHKIHNSPLTFQPLASFLSSHSNLHSCLLLHSDSAIISFLSLN